MCLRQHHYAGRVDNPLCEFALPRVETESGDRSELWDFISFKILLPVGFRRPSVVLMFVIARNSWPDVLQRVLSA